MKIKERKVGLPVCMHRLTDSYKQWANNFIFKHQFWKGGILCSICVKRREGQALDEQHLLQLILHPYGCQHNNVLSSALFLCSYKSKLHLSLSGKSNENSISLAFMMNLQHFFPVEQHSCFTLLKSIGCAVEQHFWVLVLRYQTSECPAALNTHSSKW